MGGGGSAPDWKEKGGSHDHYTQAKCHLSICFSLIYSPDILILNYYGTVYYSIIIIYTAVHDVDIIVVSSEILYIYLALTKLSLDILASISAVSINNMDCLSKIVDMA